MNVWIYERFTGTEWRFYKFARQITENYKLHFPDKLRITQKN